MSRRSSRLLSGGYYNSDEESDSSNISYRENPVKVFKKKTANRKTASRTSTRANSNASSASIDSHIIADLSPSPLITETELTMRTVPHLASPVTPRPALTPTATRSRTPAVCPSLTPDKRPGAKLSSRPNHKVQSHGSIDSSGYSSSEGTSRKLTADASSRISNAFYNTKDYLSVVAAAARSKMMHLMHSAKVSFSRHILKAVCLSVLLVSVLVCVWFLLPLLIPFVSRMPVTNTPSQTRPETQPVFPNTPPQPTTIHSTPVVNADAASTVESKAQHLLEELQLKQEHLRSQIEREMQHVRAELRTAHSSSYLQLEERVAELSRRVQDHQTDSHSTVADLVLKIQALEGQNAVLTRELASIHLPPPSTPCPSGASVHDQLTPELQKAMERWLAEHVSAEDAVRLGGKGRPDGGHPIANKMADFALETQGASVISTRCSETYRIRSACVTLFGFPLWYPSESPRTVIQGFPVLLPGKCWAFHGVQGTLVISLSHPIRITQVTLDHLPRYNSPTGRIDSAPKDFEVYGMKNDEEEDGTLLGTFTYDKDGESTQTFQLPDPSDVVYRVVELRILSNWGQVEYTCVYRFRVHGTIAAP